MNTVSAAAGQPALYTVTRVTSVDVDEQAASLGEWNQVYEQISPGRFAGSLHGVDFGGVRLFRETTNQAVHEAGSLRSGLRAFGVPVRVGGATRFSGECVDPSCVVTIGGGEDLDFYAPRDFEILGLVVEAHRLEAHARQVEHRDIQPALRHPVLRPGGERAGALRSLLGSMLQSTEVNPAALQHASTQRVLEETMLAAVVAVIDGEPPSPPGSASRRHVVDAAKAYMQARIAEPITVAELCRELGVSRRTLQYAFGEVLGTNAVAFLRALRLNGVRRDLRNKAAAPREKVQDAAARWGFWHLGHFVTDYRRMFGELPSQTLGASRSAADKTVGGMRG